MEATLSLNLLIKQAKITDVHNIEHFIPTCTLILLFKHAISKLPTPNSMHMLIIHLKSTNSPLLNKGVIKSCPLNKDLPPDPRSGSLGDRNFSRSSPG